MRIPNTAEYFALFVSTAQLSGLQSMPGAGSDLSNTGMIGVAEPVCDRYHVFKQGDICEALPAPTYQIICDNPLSVVDAACDNVQIGANVCLGRQGRDCRETYRVKSGDTPDSIASKHSVSLDVFRNNNYCYKGQKGWICPPYNVDWVVCVSKQTYNYPKCDKIF